MKGQKKCTELPDIIRDLLQVYDLFDTFANYGKGEDNAKLFSLSIIFSQVICLFMSV